MPDGANSRAGSGRAGRVDRGVEPVLRLTDPISTAKTGEMATQARARRPATTRRAADAPVARDQDRGPDALPPAAELLGSPQAAWRSRHRIAATLFLLLVVLPTALAASRKAVTYIALGFHRTSTMSPFTFW